LSASSACCQMSIMGVRGFACGAWHTLANVL